MVEIATNPDMESLKLFMSAMIALLVILIAVVGWFFSRREEVVSSAIDNLNRVVNQLEIVVGSIQTQQNERQPVIAQQLELHRRAIEVNSDKIILIDKRLGKIEAEHDLAYCRLPQRKKKGEKEQ
jgi:RNase H-fold protein (predicted Holliday junction resolvase)